MVWETAINKLTSPWINWLFYTIFERTYLIKGSSSIASTENLPISPPYKINKWKTYLFVPIAWTTFRLHLKRENWEYWKPCSEQLAFNPRLASKCKGNWIFFKKILCIKIILRIPQILFLYSGVKKSLHLTLFMKKY